MSVSNVPGRGRKQCTSCQKYVGVRSINCPNCNASFASAPRMVAVKPVSVDAALQVFLDQRREEPAQIVPPKEGPKVVETESGEKGSRIARIDFLKKELIRELKISSRGYSASILKEISDSVLKEWE